MTHQVRAHSVAGRDASVEAINQTVPIDARWVADEPSGLPGPAELLLAAFAACLMKNLARSSAIIGFEYHQADIDVTARRQERPPKFVEIEYEVRLVTDEEERHLELLHRNLRNFGTVYNTLAAVCDVHGDIVPVSMPGGSNPR
ncbi:MAG: OsmC family protein [Actinomycetes bacterium]